jgi:hypothetical protein
MQGGGGAAGGGGCGAGVRGAGGRGQRGGSAGAGGLTAICAHVRSDQTPGRTWAFGLDQKTSA